MVVLVVVVMAVVVAAWDHASERSGAILALSD